MFPCYIVHCPCALHLLLLLAACCLLPMLCSEFRMLQRSKLQLLLLHTWYYAMANTICHHYYWCFVTALPPRWHDYCYIASRCHYYVTTLLRYYAHTLLLRYCNIFVSCPTAGRWPPLLCCGATALLLLLCYYLLPTALLPRYY